MLEETDGSNLDDAKIAELSKQVRALEASRKSLLTQQLTPLVRHFVDTVPGLSQHGQIKDFHVVFCLDPEQFVCPGECVLGAGARSLLD